MTCRLRPIALCLALLLWAAACPASPADPYIHEVEMYRTQYERDLLGPEGPFTLVTKFDPKPGVSSLGRDPSNDLILPVETAPARVGKIDWQGGDHATLRLEPNVRALVDGKAVSAVDVSQTVQVKIGEMRLRLRITEQQTLRVAVSDANSRMRKDAKPPFWFPIDRQYRIVADWVPFAEAKTVRLPDNDGGSRIWKSPGIASFMLDGKNLKLQAILSADGKELSFWFRDATAGQETYGAGRFLETDLPQNGKVVIDLNKAYNPYCAFNTLYVCPIPPRENHLAVRIPVGERNYPHEGPHEGEVH